jgi:hypothetical protein
MSANGDFVTPILAIVDIVLVFVVFKGEVRRRSSAVSRVESDHRYRSHPSVRRALRLAYQRQAA